LSKVLLVLKAIQAQPELMEHKVQPVLPAPIQLCQVQPVRKARLVLPVLLALMARKVFKVK
jgi:hypothetical protein